MDIHLESIKAFYAYLQAKGYRPNIFNDIPDYEAFKNELANNLDISDSNEREYLPIPTVIELLKYFDEKVEFEDNKMYNVHACQDMKFNFLVMNSFREFYAAT